MAHDLTRVDEEVHELESSLRSIEQRLAELETEKARHPVETPPLHPVVVQPVAAQVAVELEPEEAAESSVLSLVGRTLIILGGAYLLRAITERQIVSATAGLTLGLLYGWLWSVLAYREMRKNSQSADFYNVTAAIVTLPLIWEAVVRFQLFTPEVAATILMITAAFVVGVAWRFERIVVLWIGSAASCLAGLALAGATSTLVPFVTGLTALGLASVWIAYTTKSKILRWPVAAVVDLLAILMTLLAVGEKGWDTPAAAILVNILIVTAYVGSFTIRTLLRGRDVTTFEVIQTIAVFCISFVGALWISAAGDFARTPLAFNVLLLSIGCYAVSFTFVEHHTASTKNFYFYSSLAAAMTLLAIGTLLPRTVAAIVWAILAFAAAWAARPLREPTLAYHGSLYLVAAVLASKLLHLALGAFLLDASKSAISAGSGAAVVLGVALLCALAPTLDRELHYAVVPKLIAITFAVIGIGTLAVLSIAYATNLRTSPAGMAVLRSAVIATAAIVVVLLGRVNRVREAGMLLIPILVAGGSKLLLEDLWLEDKSTVFLSLAMYGAALIVSSRLNRKSRRVKHPAEPAPAITATPN